MKLFENNKTRAYSIRIIYIILVIAVVFILAACKDASADETDDVSGSTDNSVFEEYIYRSNNILSRELPSAISGVLAHEENIVFWYADSTPEIVVTTINEHGIIKQTTHIPAEGWRVDAHGLQITGENNIELIKVEDFETGNAAVTYAVYDRQGAEITAVDISGAIARGNQFVRLKQAVFTDDGNIAVVIDEFGPYNDLLLVNKEGNLLGQLQINSVLNICKLKDGRVVALQRESFTAGAGVSLREIDFEKGDWGETLSLTIPNAVSLLPAEAGQDFDLIVSNGRLLYGYAIETNTQTPILDWMETGVIPTLDFHISFFPDDRIVILETQNVSSGEDEKWLTEFYMLSRVSRDELPPRTVITLGGFFMDEGIRQEVIAFNRENEEYQIELLQYNYRDLDRLRVEMITTGGGPDLFMDHPSFPVRSEFYADLYTFIDADPVINRTDFFQSILGALEDKDGRLPKLTQHFYLTTRLTTKETARQIEPLTYTNLLKRLDEPDAPSLYHELITGDNLITLAVNASGDTFIDLTNNKAYLDSEEFISLLEIAARSTESLENINITPSSEAEWVNDVRSGKTLLFPIFYIESAISATIWHCLRMPLLSECRQVPAVSILC